MNCHIIPNNEINSAETLARIEETEKKNAEYNAMKDEALFQTASANKTQIELLKQQLEEAKTQNIKLMESNQLLNELYKTADLAAQNNEKEAKDNKKFGWWSLGIGTAIGIAGIVFGVLF